MKLSPHSRLVSDPQIEVHDQFIHVYTPSLGRLFIEAVDIRPQAFSETLSDVNYLTNHHIMEPGS